MPYINGKKVLGVVRTKYLNVDDVYPIGAVYISFDSTSPASLFGGTWERLNNAFLYATNNDNSIGSTGGEETHTLTTNEMPSHTHILKAINNTGSFENVGVIKTTSWTGSSSDITNVEQVAPAYGLGIQKTGGDQAHNNMPPFVKVAIWKRTA